PRPRSCPLAARSDRRHAWPLTPALWDRAAFFHCKHASRRKMHSLSLHDALPIWEAYDRDVVNAEPDHQEHGGVQHAGERDHEARSEEHTSELQSRSELVCRLLLEKTTLRHGKHAYRRNRPSPRRPSLHRQPAFEK